MSLWRAVAVFRVVALAVCLYLIIRWRDLYARPEVAWVAAAAMIAVTGLLLRLAYTSRAHRPLVVAFDLVVTAVITLGSLWVQQPDQLHGGMPTLTTIWAAGPVIEAAIVFGWFGGSCAALIEFIVSIVVRDGYDGRTLNNGVLLLVTGLVVGYATRLLGQSERRLAVATAARSSLEEREQLSREIHDDVLQVLALVHRTARGMSGIWAEIGNSAARAEASVRRLATARSAQSEHSAGDLARALHEFGDARVTVSVPAAPLPLDPHTVAELLAAVRAALHNVAQHAGPDPQTWIFCEETESDVRISVRDDGVGFAPERLDQAARSGRLGVAHSIRRRVEGIGGSVAITSAPGRGTELEFTIPKRAE
ncbi:MAG: signal transduction histidine kinase [Pseudonocardiales bacterium]|nr:signal transduction histidine kinase [Pseudonocardiales bacterium]